MILIKTFAGECLIRQDRDLGRELGKLPQCVIELVGGELLGRAGMHRLFMQRCRISLWRDPTRRCEARMSLECP